MANAWNELVWGIGNYGEQNNHTEIVDSVSASSSIGDFEIVTQQILSIEGFGLSANLGNPEIDVLNNGWGASTWGFSTWGQTGDVILGTNLATTAIGSVIARAGATGFPNSILLQTVNESPTIRIDNEAILTGIQSQFTVGDTSPAADANTGFFGSVTAQTLNGVVEVNGEIQIGWGGDTWGENEWGDLSGAYANLTGISLSANIGSIITEANANVDVTGIQLQLTNQGVVAGTSALIEQQGIEIQIVTGNEEINLGVPVTGINLNTVNEGVTIADQPLIGSGWGRSYWNDFVWGDNYSTQTGSVSAQTVINGVTTQADANVNVQGQQLFVVTGNETPQANANAFPTGINIQSNTGQIEGITIQGSQMNTGIGVVDIQAGANIFVNVTEHTLQGTVSGDSFVFANYIEEVAGIALQTVIGNETAFTDVTVELGSFSLTTAIGDETAFTDVTVEIQGQQQLNTFIGDENTQANADVNVTSLSITGTVGDLTFISTYSVTGIDLTALINSVIVQANADVTVTGSGLTTSPGSTNITAWAEVNTGTPVNWTPVDLAA